MEQLIKALSLSEFKLDDDTGTVKAVFATMNVVDKDGDVTLPGFFGDQDVAIAWGHNRLELIGKGKITEVGDEARFEGKFFLDTVAGTERYKTVKAMGGLQEWSYGFHLDADGFKFGEHENRQVRFLQPKADGTPGALISEVSPVLVGAGEGTHTAAIKSSGLRFVEQAEQVAQAVELLYARAAEIKQLRSEKDQDLGNEAVARLLEVKTRLLAAGEMFGGLIETPEPEPDHTAVLMTARRHLAEAGHVTAGR